MKPTQEMKTETHKPTCATMNRGSFTCDCQPKPQAGERTHTPGPWRLTNEIDRTGYIMAGAGDFSHTLAIVEHTEFGDTKSTARLIAAAPELLAALEAVDRFFSEPGKHNARSVAESVRAAIERLESAADKNEKGAA